ncbi:MAG: hypothetical protein LBM69_01485, partial [Lachnospiraceae bacterium]|nr:hypothetical protein [Lachnospiraceae bacterium]
MCRKDFGAQLSSSIQNSIFAVKGRENVPLWLRFVTIHAFADLRLKIGVSRTNRAEPGGVLGVRLS